MPLFEWFSKSETEAFARALAKDLIGRLPAKGADGNKKLSPERVKNTREAIFSRAVAFARSHNVNWYRKAHLGNTFKWELLNAGHDKAFADSWTYDVLIVVTSKKYKP